MAPAVEIAASRLVDWLVDRRVLPNKWRSRLQVVQLKAGEAGLQMSPEFRELLGGVCYQTSKLVRDRLLEHPEVNALGFYTGTTAVWQKLIRAYEKDGLHVGEAALTLVRNAEFEMPFLRTQIARQQQQLIDLDKKEAEYAKSAAAAQRFYQQECGSFGIQGRDVVRELEVLASSLAQVLFDVLRKLQRPSVSQAKQLYVQFVNFISQGKICEGTGNGDTALSLLSRVLQADICLPEEGPCQEGREGLGVGQLPSYQGAQVEDAGHVSGTQSINWDIESDSGSVAADSNDSLVTEDTGGKRTTQGVVDQLMHDSQFRNALVLELSELQAFLDMRCAEISNPGYLSVSTAAPEGVLQINLPELRLIQEELRQCLLALVSDRVKMLLALRTSPSYLRRIAAALQRQAQQEAKFYRLQREVEAKRQEVQEQLVENAPRLTTLVESSQALKAFVEQQLSTVFNGSEVHILGDFSVR